MGSKMIAVMLVLCALQGIQSKSIKPFWGMNPLFLLANDPTIDPELQTIVAEIQMRISQISSVSKATIGTMVGMAQKNIGLTSSQAKNSIKLAVNNVESNPSVTKECLKANEASIDILSDDAKSQLSVCIKGSQLQLKGMSQVQKEISLQASMLTSQTSVIVSQCRLENPLPTDTANVTECVRTKAEDIKAKIAALEEQLLQTVSAVQAGISQITSEAETCGQQVQEQLQQELNTVSQQLEECSTPAPAPALAPLAF